MFISTNENKKLQQSQISPHSKYETQAFYDAHKLDTKCNWDKAYLFIQHFQIFLWGAPTAVA